MTFIQSWVLNILLDDVGVILFLVEWSFHIINDHVVLWARLPTFLLDCSLHTLRTRNWGLFPLSFLLAVVLNLDWVGVNLSDVVAFDCLNVLWILLLLLLDIWIQLCSHLFRFLNDEDASALTWGIRFANKQDLDWLLRLLSKTLGKYFKYKD